VDSPDKIKLFIKRSPDFFNELNQLSLTHLNNHTKDLSNFLVGFKEAYDKAQSIKYSEYVKSNQTQIFLTSMKEALRISQQMRMQEAPDFNIFNILKIARREVVATAMWKDLLDPKGLHEQGSLFLRPFLKLLDDKLQHMGKEFHSYAEQPINLWITSTEEFVRKVKKDDKDGRIDVYLKHMSSNLALAIEYKIGADDQERQVSRYYDHLKEQKFNHPHVIYITPTGVKPSEFSLGKMDEKKVICMSIQHELVPMLNRIQRVNANIPKKLNYFIKDYVEVARS